MERINLDMKRIFLLVTMTAVFSMTGCSLKERLISNSETKDYYTTTAEVRTGLNACYNAIRAQLAGNGFWEATECATDLMILNQSMRYDATLDISPTKPAIASSVWQYSYLGVMRANGMLAAIDLSVTRGSFSDDEALPLRGEAVVLRAFFYYLLTCTFGDVPYYTEEVTHENRPRIASLPRMSADDTRDSLIAELEHYLFPESLGGLEALELRRSYDGTSVSRLGAAAGLMIAAKFCLWNRRWDEAVKVIGVLEDIYGHYSDSPSSFGVDYGLQVTGNIAMIASPSHNYGSPEGSDDEFTHTDVYDGIGIPELGSDARISTPARPTTYCFMTVLPYSGPDLRSGDYSDGASSSRNGSGNLAWRWKGYASNDNERLQEGSEVRWFKASPKANNRPWLGNKFWCYGMYYTQDSNNYKFFRFADALLMKAEAYLMLGDHDMAAKYLNITRTRAGVESLTFASVGGNVEAFMEEIRLERARELFGEFQRKFDLVRWGIWYERTSAYNDGMYLPGFIRPYHRYLPIPAEQVTYSGGALDNREYEQ